MKQLRKTPKKSPLPLQPQKLDNKTRLYLTRLADSSFPLSLCIFAAVDQVDEALAAHWPLETEFASQAASVRSRIAELARSCAGKEYRGLVQIAVNVAYFSQTEPSLKAPAVFACFDAAEGTLRECRLNLGQTPGVDIVMLGGGLTVLCQPYSGQSEFRAMDFSAPQIVGSPSGAQGNYQARVKLPAKHATMYVAV